MVVSMVLERVFSFFGNLGRDENDAAALDNFGNSTETSGGGNIAVINGRPLTFHMLFLITGIFPLLVAALFPFYSRYRAKRRLREAEERRAMSTKIAGPIREAHLLDHMRNYSMVLSKFDIADANDIEEGAPTTETSDEMLTLPSSSDDENENENENENNISRTDDSEDIEIKMPETKSMDDEDEVGSIRHNNDDIEMQASKRNSYEKDEREKFDDSSPNNVNDDIEMQISKTNSSEEDIVTKERENISTRDGRDDITTSTKNPPKDEDSEADELDAVDDLSSLGYCQTIYVPPPGQKVESCREGSQKSGSQAASSAALLGLPAGRRRASSEGCIICFSPFEVNQKVTWSSNPECPHVFHHKCLLEWFDTIGSKAFTSSNRDNNRDQQISEASIREDVCDFSKPCPCCRREFFLDTSRSCQQQRTNEGESEENLQDSTTESPVPPTGSDEQV